MRMEREPSSRRGSPRTFRPTSLPPLLLLLALLPSPNADAFRTLPSVRRSAALRSRWSRPFLTQQALPSIDWSFLDAAFIITCPNADGSNPRLDKALAQLREVGLTDQCEVRAFATDDEDRVRGCYNSHVAVLEEAAARFADRPATEPLNVLVLEDNLSISPRIEQRTLDAMQEFLTSADALKCPGGRPPDMVHLAYIMYVPGLSVEGMCTSTCLSSSARAVLLAAICFHTPSCFIAGLGTESEDERWREHIVRLRCNADSVLGTTAYIISRSGLDAVIAEHRRAG